MLTLELKHIDEMRYDFKDEYDLLFINAFKRLEKTINIKLKAIKYCRE